jgi:hypothetical protein
LKRLVIGRHFTPNRKGTTTQKVKPKKKLKTTYTTGRRTNQKQTETPHNERRRLKATNQSTQKAGEKSNEVSQRRQGKTNLPSLSQTL